MSVRRARTRSGMLVGLGSLLVVTLLATTTAAAAAAPKTRVASLSSADTQVRATNGSLSRNGRFAVFPTRDDGVVSGDSNGREDVFRRDLGNGRTAIVSVSSSEQSGDGDSWDGVVSASGRYVAFTSEATNLIDGKVMSGRQAYLRDMRSGKTFLVSRGRSGPADADSYVWDISANGRYVVFWSEATNLTRKNTNGVEQIYLRDRKAGKTYLISRDSRGRAGNGFSAVPVVSDDGRYVAFVSESDNLVRTNTKGQVQVYRHDRRTGKTVLVSRNNRGKAGNGGSDAPAISASGAVIVYSSNASNLLLGGKDTNGASDVFRRLNGRTTRVSTTYTGGQLDTGAGWPWISDNGRWLVFDSDATNATKVGHSGAYDLVYLRDLASGRVTLVSRTGAAIANGQSWPPVISGDGRYVAFGSDATNLIPGGDTNGALPDLLRRGPYR